MAADGARLSARSETAARELDRLARAHAAERLESRERSSALLASSTLADRVARGQALDRPDVDAIEASPGGRLRLWLRPRRGVDLDDLRIRPGDPLRLWWESPTEPDAVRAIASRRDRDRLSVVVDADAPDRVLEGDFRVDRESPEATFDRGDAAIRRANAAKTGSDLGRIIEVVLGDEAPRSGRSEDLDCLDPGLLDAQREAVQRALAATTIALVHGPPGTGKTRTLVELVRQAVRRGERLLVTAPSHAALDTLGERLLEARVPLVRLGHPARASETMESATLDARIADSDASTLARRFVDEAAALRKRASRMSVRSREERDARREAYAEARRLDRDARRVLDVEADRQLARAKVVLATLAASEDPLLREVTFDRVVVDEATQAIDPLVLVPLGRAKVAVLAGDPEQLPPTVLSRAAADLGLGRTIFERLRDRYGAKVCVTLDVQHRMHEALAAFPNETFYSGALRTAEHARSRSLKDLDGILADDARPSPLAFIDTAGRGYEEEQSGDDASTSNPGQAERTALEVRRLLSRGLSPRDLAVITPYEAQARRLRGLLADARAQGLEIGTVDGFQGREKEVVVIDMVRSNADGRIGFLAETRRTNVAITRARRQLLVVGDASTLAGHPFYGAMIDAAIAAGAYRSAWDDEAAPVA